MSNHVDLDPRTVASLRNALDALLGKQEPMRSLPVYPNGTEAKTAEDVAVLLGTTPDIARQVLFEVKRGHV